MEDKVLVKVKDLEELKSLCSKFWEYRKAKLRGDKEIDYRDFFKLIVKIETMVEFMEVEGMDNLVEKVRDWGRDKDLIHKQNANKQFMKFIEEVFEFKTEFDLHMVYNELYEKDRDLVEPYITDDLKLEFGDILVTLIILAADLDISPYECLKMAYEKISKREGKTIGGIFYKEEDL